MNTKSEGKLGVKLGLSRINPEFSGKVKLHIHTAGHMGCALAKGEEDP